MSDTMIDEQRLIEAIRALDEDEDSDEDSVEMPRYWAYYLAQVDDWKGVLARAIIVEYERAADRMGRA